MGRPNRRPGSRAAPANAGHWIGSVRAVPTAHQPSLGRRLLAIATHVAVAVATTAPLLWRPGLPLGDEPAATVPRFNLWTLRWTADRLPHGLHGWWDAPIFAPSTGTFAWSEPQPGTGAAFALLRPLAGDARAYALLVIAFLALDGIAGAALARRLGTSARAALLSGILVQTVPFLWDQLGVLQLLALWPLLGAMASLLAWASDPRPRHALAVGAMAVAGAWTCGTATALGGVSVAVGSLALVRRSWWGDPHRRRGLALMAAGPLLLAVPLALAQRQHLEGRAWMRATILAGSARPDDWVSGRTAPGAALVGLGLLGLWCLRRRRSAWFVAATGATAALAAAGLRLQIGPLAPWSFLVDHLDAFARLRSPYRAAAIVQVVLAVLAAGVLDRAVRWRGRAGPVLAVALVAAAVATAGVGAGPLVSPAAVAGDWRSALAERGREEPGAVAFLPFAPDRSAAAFAPTTERMLQNLGTGVPMVNGYSGFFPPDHATLRADLRGFPDERSLRALQSRGARWAVVDPATWDRVDARAADALGVRTLVESADGLLLELPRA